MKIFVCPLSRVAELVALHHPARVISMLDPDTIFPELGPSYADRHLRLRFHDITIPRDNYTMPQAEHVAGLISFVAACQPTDSILIHCYAGISRSTAAAYIASCAARPEANEHALAVSLRRTAPLSRPNGAMVALADCALGRAGRMNAGIEITGRDLPWVDVDEGEPFAISLA